MLFSQLVYESEIPSYEDRKERVYYKDKNPADIRNESNYHNDDKIDSSSHGKKNQCNDIIPPSDRPNLGEDLGKIDSLADAVCPGKPDHTENSK